MGGSGKGFYCGYEEEHSQRHLKSPEQRESSRQHMTSRLDLAMGEAERRERERESENTAKLGL